MLSSQEMAALRLRSGVRPLRSLLGWPALLGALATIALGVAVWATGRHAGLSTGSVIMLTLFSLTFWISLAGGPLAGGADNAVSALCRCGALADASLVVLAVLAIWSGGLLGLLDALKIYVLWAAMVLASGSVTRLAHSSAGRAAWGIAASVLMTAALASLFWSPGLLAALHGPSQLAWAKLVLTINPLAGVSTIMGPKLAFDWYTQPMMYGVARFGQDFPPPVVGWWAPALVLAGVAAAAGLIAGARRVYHDFYYGS